MSLHAPAVPTNRASPILHTAPDPLPARRTGWREFRRLGTWIAGVSVLEAALLLAPTEAAGIAACTVAALCVAVAALRRTPLPAWVAAEIGMGLWALAMLHGFEASGRFAVAAVALLACGIGLRMGAAWTRPGLVPLAGRVPWLFRRRLRRFSLLFAAAGATLGLVVALATANPLLNVLGLAALPLGLRALWSTLLTGAERRRIWTLSAAAHLFAALLLIPDYGALGAAWGVVVAETTMALATRLAFRHRTSTRPFTNSEATALCAAAALLGAMHVVGPSWSYVPFGLGALGTAALIGWLARRSFRPRRRLPPVPELVVRP